MRLGVYGERSGFTVFAQVVVWTVGVHALVPRPTDLFVAPIADDVGMPHIGLSLNRLVRDVVITLVELDERVAWMRLVDGG